jgi:alkanesulfonate monooxygenase SsuD/methylene tetrahydromethanopterin reductase-like flavin-dependent oxidoreductase (luciferase family)
VRFGLSFLPDGRGDGWSAREYYVSRIELAREADRAGLASVKMTEHYLHAYGGACPSPLAFLAAVAAAAPRIRLMTGGVLPAFHHPIQLASETAMVDALSGGRLDVGFARAYMPYEFAAFGVPIDESRDRFVAAVDAVVRLWRDRDVSLTTPFFSFADATVLPRPTQAPHPPVWVAASLSPETFTWAGRRGFGLLTTNLLTDPAYLAELIGTYRAAFAESPHGRPGRGEVALSVPLFVAPSDEDAITDGERYLARYLDVWADAAEAWRARDSAAYRGYSHMADVIRRCRPERLRTTGAAVVGCASRVRDAVAGLCERFGPDLILWQVDFGGMPAIMAAANLRELVERVLPYVAPPGGDHGDA